MTISELNDVPVSLITDGLFSTIVRWIPLRAISVMVTRASLVNPTIKVKFLAQLGVRGRTNTKRMMLSREVLLRHHLCFLRPQVLDWRGNYEPIVESTYLPRL